MPVLIKLLCAWAGLLCLALAVPAFSGELGRIDFPKTDDGRLILPIDFHTHTVFSDGFIWPTVQVDQAVREGLVGIAVTDHLEWQPHRADIPNGDRNRSYDLALEEAKALGTAERTPPLVVIRGAEVTRGIPPGHLNAVFLTDVNKLLGRDYPECTDDPCLSKLYEDTPKHWATVRAALLKARDQGAFIILNHPDYNFDAGGQLNARNLSLITEGLTNGIEVANGTGYTEAAFQLALDRHLAIIGASDLHGTSDHLDDFYKRYDGVVPTAASTAHRTVTLVLASAADPASIRAALFSRSTVALYANQLFGREPEVRAILLGALTSDVKQQGKDFLQDEVLWTVSNRASIPFTLRYVGKRSPWSSSDIFSVPAHGSVEIAMNHVAADELSHLEPLEVEVLNAYTSPRRHPTVKLIR
jgi:3',5'-nucleoside bisphosphate phosphatase